MIVWVELSGENPDLARAEVRALLQRLGATPAEGLGPDPGILEAVVPAAETARGLAQAVSLARRVEAELHAGPAGELVRWAGALPAADGRSASFEWAGSEGSGSAELTVALEGAYRGAGGKVRRRLPERRFRLRRTGTDRIAVAEVIAEVPRSEYATRRMPLLPFQRPVSLPPRRARAAANLAGVGPGSRVADPFVGTGALLLEAGLLGGRLFGSDVDATMVRGALRNLEAVGVSAESVVVADAASAPESLPWTEVDAVLTDPPYGRASSSRGEPPTELAQRALASWATRVRPGGRMVVVGPGPALTLPEGWALTVELPDRVHRSLTRMFRVYERATRRQ